jgi:hemolysin III
MGGACAGARLERRSRGILLKLLWVRAPKWLSAAIGLGLGWVGAAAFSQLLKLQLPACCSLSPEASSTRPAQSCTYDDGLTRSRGFFGYHELFHVLTLAATACLYVSVAFFVLPLG